MSKEKHQVLVKFEVQSFDLELFNKQNFQTIQVSQSKYQVPM